MGDRPPLIRPMRAMLSPQLPVPDDQWGFEYKWDGVRAITYAVVERVCVLSRNDIDITASCPELVELTELITRPVILDGEIVAIRGGRPDFGLLQSRMHVQRPTEPLLRAIPVEYYVFDVLHLDDPSLLGHPYVARRAVLDDLALTGHYVQTPPWFRGGGEQVLAASVDLGLEGVVAKRLDSHYYPGKRSRDWLKVKNVRHQEVVLRAATIARLRRPAIRSRPALA
jgi:bifunctional non-homologous end joining protein LigD